jgi:hypothetical protein
MAVKVELRSSKHNSGKYRRRIYQQSYKGWKTRPHNEVLIVYITNPVSIDKREDLVKRQFVNIIAQLGIY